MILWGDLETYSTLDLRQVGTYRYAEAAEVMLFSYALDDGPVQLWDLTTGAPMPDDLEEALVFADRFVFQNSMFDRTILRLALNSTDLMRAIGRSRSRWFDTMVQAYCHALPGGLDKLCTIFKLPYEQAKLKEGKQLVQLFCKLRPANQKLERATRRTHPAEWKQFCEYAMRDVTSMRAVARKMPTWNYSGAELALWHLDQKINDRGFAIDTELVNAAIEVTENEKKRLAKRTREITNGEVEKATQRDQVLAHVLSQYGITLPDMQAATLERRINDPELPEALRELLRIRLQASATSSSKYKKLLQGISSDGRLHGATQFAGAGRTMRWAGRFFQPQNLPRPALKQADIELGIDALKCGAADLLYDNLTELTSSALRGAIVAEKGNKLVVSDLANIEGRGLVWLANESWKLRAFAEFDGGIGADMYCLAYARSFGVDAASVDSKQRQLGKVQELALGYQGGVGAFVTMAMTYRMELNELPGAVLPVAPRDVLLEAQSFYDWADSQGRTLGLGQDVFVACDVLKRLWRNAHPNVVALWNQVENAARNAIQHPDVPYGCGRVVFIRNGAWLRGQLPSGRYMCYPDPKVNNEGKISYMGIDTYTKRWQRINTYGGKLVENITQAVARDVMAANMPAIEDTGYNILLTVHDEVLTETPDVKTFTAEGLSTLLAKQPPWAVGLPLAAKGFEAYRYRKD